MKNIFFVFLLAVFCGEAFAKDFTLDSAITTVAAKIIKSPKIGKEKKIVLTDFSDSIEFQNYIEEELTNKLIEAFTIVDRRNLGILQEELEFQYAGKVDIVSIKKRGSIYGADFILQGSLSLKEKKLEISVRKVQDAELVLKETFSIEEDYIWKNLEKNKLPNILTKFGNIFSDKLPEINKAIEIAVSHLGQKILESKENKILVYNIWADKSELSELIHNKIEKILADNKDITLLSNRSELGKIKTEMSFQSSGEVDASTIKERGKWLGANVIIYGNIRPIGNNYRMFLYAVNVENAKIIATKSLMVNGDEKEIKNIALPSKINKIEVEPLSSDRIIISWENISNARNFIVYRVSKNGSIEKQIPTRANRIIDFGLKPETKYCYYVKARNTDGTGEQSETKCKPTYGVPKFGDNKPKIKGKTENSVVVIWNKVPGASYYKVKRCFKDICNYLDLKEDLRDTIYNDSYNLHSSTVYGYLVEAENSAGRDTSDRIEVITKPIPPINIIATEISADKIKIKWEDKQENISHYIVEGYSNKISNKMVEIAKLKPETRYPFRLKSVNTTNDESVFSKPLEVMTLGRPNAPDSVKIQIDSTFNSKTITISWRSVFGADSYVIYKDNQELKSTKDTSYQGYYPREKGTEIIYSIFAKNAAGESEKKSVSILTEPLEPIITKKDIGDNRFYIEWAPAPNVYKYLIKSNNGDTLVMDTYFKKENLPYSSTLTYCVKAVNKTGESDCLEKNTIIFKTLDVPQKPNDLKLLSVSVDSIMLRWNTVQNANDGYVLYLCEKDRFDHKDCKKSLYKGNDTNYIHTGLKANTEYEYAVVAKNVAGESEKTYGKEKTCISSPTNIKTEIFGLDSVKITWQKSDGASYYKIYKKEGNGDSSFIGRNVKTEWVDKKIEADREYFYYLAAVSENEKESISKVEKRKIGKSGVLVLRNRNESGYHITSYEIKKGSEIIKKENSYIGSGADQSIVLSADGKYDLSIINSNGEQIKGKDKFDIKAGQETIFIYNKTLRKQP